MKFNQSGQSLLETFIAMGALGALGLFLFFLVYLMYQRTVIGYMAEEYLVCVASQEKLNKFENACPKEEQKLKRGFPYKKYGQSNYNRLNKITLTRHLKSSNCPGVEFKLLVEAPPLISGLSQRTNQRSKFHLFNFKNVYTSYLCQNSVRSKNS
jgi:hypothetical protein